MNWYPRIMLRKYASFSGRARRKEYWMFFLVYALLSGSITAVVMGLDWVVDFVTRGRWADSFSLEAGLTLGVFALIHLLPSIALTVRSELMAQLTAVNPAKSSDSHQKRRQTGDRFSEYARTVQARKVQWYYKKQ